MSDTTDVQTNDDPTQTPVDTPNEENSQQVPDKKDRYKEDLLKFKDRNKELEDEVKALREKQENDRIAKMKEQDRFKELADEYEAKAQKAEEDAKTLRSAVIADKKLSAIKQEAMKLGIRKEALDDLDMLSLDSVDIETTSTGRVNILNANVFAENLKIQKPHWFGKRSSNFNSSEPEITPMGAVSLDMIKKAEQEYKKTGDSTKYEALLRKYKQQ